MSSEQRNTVPTGVAPIDEAIGGLEHGRVHLLYGELETGKTTIGMRFLAEGLAAGERGPAGHPAKMSRPAGWRSSNTRRTSSTCSDESRT